MDNRPTFIFRDRVITEEIYVEWLHEVKSRFRKSQLKAAVRVNTAMLEFYWGLGRDIVAMHAESKWGDKFFKQRSLDMKAEFPEENGFSAANLRYMKRWYDFYFQRVINRQQAADEFIQQGAEQIVHQLGEDLENGQRPVDEIVHQSGEQLEMPETFGLIPWKHHVHIFTKCQSLNEALFYINRTIEEHWSRSTLENYIDAGLYTNHGAAVTNFKYRLPAPQSDLAQELLKSEYNLEFLHLKAKHDEKELEEKIAANVTRFLLELGKGFAYVGRQMELQMPGGQTFFPDLVFYHIPQKRYMVIELKAVKFMPEHAGKLNFYVTAADRLLKGNDDNPSIGLLICRSMDKTLVEWSLADIQKPLGVATYQIEEVVERTIKELELQQKGEKGE